MDIRQFFGGKPQEKEKQAGGPAQNKKRQAEEQLSQGSKKAKLTGNNQETPKKPKQQQSKSPKKPTPQPKQNQKNAGNKKGQQNNKSKNVKRKTVLVDSDSEDDAESSDQYQPDIKNYKSEESDSEVEIHDNDDSDVEIVQSNKKGAKKQAQNQTQNNQSASRPSRKAPQVADVGPKKGVQKPTKQANANNNDVSLKDQVANGKGPKQLQEMVMAGGAKEAMEIVNKIASNLPPEDGVKFSLVENNTEFGGGNDNTTPPRYGEKEVPNGHPDCLTGKTFVISGVLESLHRNEADSLIKRHGGRTTTGVSGRTDFLVCGDNTGRSKYNAAKQKKTKIIDEDGLFKMIQATQSLLPKKPEPEIQQTQQQSQNNHTKEQKESHTINLKDDKISKKPKLEESSKQQPKPRQQQKGSGQLWVDKYKPKTAQDLVGNAAQIKLLRDWLSQWYETQTQGPGQGASVMQRGKVKDLSKKAILMSGDPGIGKTSSAYIISKELGMNSIEVNASDTRNKADSKVNPNKGIGGKYSNVLRELVTNSTIQFTYKKEQQQDIERTVLIMDEVDGMSSGDRGGVGELIELIKQSKMPIICICNDKYNRKLSSLKNHCLELDFTKPNKATIAKRMQLICNIENLSINQVTLESICEQANCDVRLILGQLQFIKMRQDVFGYDDIKGKLNAGKDMDLSPFDVSRRLLGFENQNMTLMTKIDMVFQDMDLIPLLVQENYLNHKPSLAQNEAQKLKVISKAADAISLGDIVNNNIRRQQNWNLMPYYGFIGTVFPSTYMRGMRDIFNLYPGEPNFPRFTAWLGNNSSQGKNYRLMSDLLTVMRASNNFVGGKRDVRLEYMGVLKRFLAKEMKEAEDAEDLSTALEIMKEYCLTKDDFDYIISVTQFKSKAKWNTDETKDVPTKIKSSFTRQVNQSIKPRCSTMVEDFKRSRKTKAPAIQENENGELEGDVQENEKVDEGEEQEQDNPEDVRKQLESKQGINFEAKQASGKGKKGGSGAKKGSNKQAGSGRGRKK